MSGPIRLQRLVSSRWRFSGLIVLLGLFLAQTVAASQYHSVTFDEQYHITPGYVYLKTGDLRFHHDQNPPLFEAILSAPLLARSDIHLPLDHPAYQLWGDVYLFSDVFLWHANNDAQSLVQTGRIMAALAGALLGLLLFVWGKQLYGEIAGWIAAFLFVFDPNFIANAIPTLDLGLALTSTLAVWCLWRYLKQPRPLTLVLAGLALGFALATKFLSVMLLPSFLSILLIYPALPATHHTRRSRLISFVLMILLAWFVLWATYRFQFGPINGIGLPVFAPQYFESFIGMFFKSSEGRANYLLGQVSTTGWPYYFIVAFLVKTPLPTLIAICFAFIRWPWRREWRTTSVLIVPALFFFAGASISQLQLGYRYLLPVLPFLFIMAGRATQDAILSQKRWLKVGAAVLAAWLVVDAIAIFPDHLSYFNEAVGGPASGYHYLVDSNVDWGQDLPALKDWIGAHQPDQLHLGFFGSAYPDRYGVDATGIPGYPNSAYGAEADAFTSYSLEPGQYALSATLLRIGLVSRLYNAYQAFESMRPIDQVAHSILIYDVKYPDNAEVDRAVIVGPPASEVPPNALGYRADHPLRAKWCEPEQCFIYTPHPARYIVRNFIPFAPDLAAQSKNLARTVEAAPSYGDDHVYELDATSILQNKLQQLQTAPVAVPGGLTATLPITFDNGLALAGYEVTQTTPHNLEVNTYWRVTGPITPPVTIFVHLLDKDGNIRGQNDSFGAATRMLEPGDIIVQHHPISIDAGAPPGQYRLQAGLYNPATSDRFKAHPMDLPETDRILLAAVEINP